MVVKFEYGKIIEVESKPQRIISGHLWKVYITFDKENSWSSLKSKYNELKEQFTAKYGNGKSYEFFSTPYFEGDGYETTALSVDKCTWSTFWNVENGNIAISIQTSQYIGISYEDTKNTVVMDQEKNEIINNDI